MFRVLFVTPLLLGPYSPPPHSQAPVAGLVSALFTARVHCRVRSFRTVEPICVYLDAGAAAAVPRVQRRVSPP